MTVRSERLEFDNGRGQLLAARLEWPAEAPRAWAIFAHCFTCSKDIAAAGRISRSLASTGVAVLRFDFTGLGGSEGELANESFSSNVHDLVAAAGHLRENFEAPSLLIGHSLGGAAVLVAAPRIPEVLAVATIGAPGDPQHVTRLFEDELHLVQRDGRAEVDIAGRPFTISNEFVEDLKGQSIPEALKAYKGALLVCHAPRDETVSIDHASMIYRAANHPKSFLSLDGADHLLTRKPDALYVARVLEAWVSRYVMEDRRPSAAETEVAGEGEVIVSESGPLYTQTIKAGHHLLTADEPTTLGGADLGPTPYGLLLAGLGSCTTITLRMYANHKKWPLSRVSVSLTHSKIHAKDCESCESDKGKADRITRTIRLEGDLSDEQRARLLEIADRCPVHRTLEGEKEILTALAEDL